MSSNDSDQIVEEAEIISFSVNEVAEITGFSIPLIYKLIQQHDLPAVDLGKKRRKIILKKDLLAFLKHYKVGGRIGLDNTIYAQHDLVTRKITEIRSFLAGSPGTRPSSETICYWVWFCYEFELYQEGAELFRKINEDAILRDLFVLTRQLGLACEGRC
jgi:excisionase family DNA binding protein